MNDSHRTTISRTTHKPDAQLSPIVTARYAAGDSFAAIASEEHMSEERVGRLLRDAGVTVRKACKPRTYTHDPHFFDAITDEARAYWLGFIYADGCVTTGNRLQVTLAAKDAGHLSKLRDALSSTHPVTISTRKCGFAAAGMMAAFSIRCCDLADGLARHGVTPRKSHTARPPALPPELLRHFWRGVMDGDGFISTAGGTLTVGVTGNRETCDGFAEWARSLISTHANVKANHSIWTFAVGGSHLPSELLALLYEGATVALDRKATMASEAILHARSGPPRGPGRKRKG